MTDGRTAETTTPRGEAPEVAIAQGRLRGCVENGVDVFKGIPFAAAPVGSLRWKPPQPAPGWSGVRDASRFGPACVQPPIPGGADQLNPIASALGEAGETAFDEDCLNLNVWRPLGTGPEARLPVMVWAYGGGFQYGWNAQKTYDGAALARRDVILVTPNYRVGIFGFIAHPDLSAEDPDGSSGNYGLLDVLAALRWVQDNIAAFGGNPGNVTLFGESAGGAIVGELAGSPLSDGLFHRSISQSGVFFGPLDRGEAIPGMRAADQRLGTAEQMGVAAFARAGIGTLAEGRAMPAEQLLAAIAPSSPAEMPFFFRPNVDGHVLPEMGYDLLANGAYDRRPALVGSNDDEGVLFFGQPVPPQQAIGMAHAVWGAFAPTVLAGAGPMNDQETATRTIRDMVRDATFAWPAFAWARTQRGEPVYLYWFAQRPPFPDSPEFAGINAAHAVDLPYVFGTLDNASLAWTDGDRRLSETIIGYWTNFAKSGNPNSPGLPQWDAFESDERLMRFGENTAEMAEIPNRAALDSLDDIYASMRTTNE